MPQSSPPPLAAPSSASSSPTTSPAPPDPEPTREPESTAGEGESSPANGSRSPQGRLTAPLPRIPGFHRPPSPQRPSDAQEGPTASSRASIEPTRVERIPLAEFRAAIREAVDIVFLIFGALVGRALDHRRHREHDPEHWKQTPAERKAVVDPGSRLVRRHLKNEPKAQDTLDLLLVGTGVARYGGRTVLDIPDLEQLPEEDPDHAA